MQKNCIGKKLGEKPREKLFRRSLKEVLFQLEIAWNIDLYMIFSFMDL